MTPLDADALALAAHAAYGPHWLQVLELRAELFGLQLALYDDAARRRAAHPGRRAGKTTGMPRFALLDALQCGPSEVVILGAETRMKAESLHRATLGGLIARHRLPYAYNGKLGAFLSVRGDGSGIYLWGIADRGAADMLRGFKVRSAWFDEVATYSQHLYYIADDALGPALSDLGGALTYCGTPSLTRAGPWFELCTGARKGWSVHHWDVRQNPFFGRDASPPITPADMLALEAARAPRGWDDATFQREFLGLFVDDPDSRVYAWSETTNACEWPADFTRGAWPVVIGVDFGVSDDCAWTVLGAHPHRREVVELHAEKHVGLLPDEACKVTRRLCAEFGASALVGDSGGLGKPYVELWNQRYSDVRKGVPMMAAAEKVEKRAAIQVWNGEARAGRVRTVRGRCSALIGERLSLPWKDSAKLVEDPRYPNHLCDAALYAFRYHSAYLHRPEAPREPARPTPDAPEAIRREAERVGGTPGRAWYDR